jgi:hypothetical protein
LTREDARLLGWHTGASVFPSYALDHHGCLNSTTHQAAFVALPDGHTVVGLQFCQTDAHRTYAGQVKGLHLSLLNDLFSRFRRQLTLRPLLRSVPGVHR